MTAAPWASPVGVMMGVGPEITDVDDGFLRIVGYTRADFAAGGMNWQAMTPPEFLHLDAAGIQQALASASGFTAPYAKEFIRKDGSRSRCCSCAPSFQAPRASGSATSSTSAIHGALAARR